MAGEAAADADGAASGGHIAAAGPGGSNVPGLFWQGAGALIDFDVDGPVCEDATFLHLMCAALVRPRGMTPGYTIENLHNFWQAAHFYMGQ
jgi:hypothetical protein